LIQVHQLGLADILDSKHLFFPNLLILNSNAGRNKVAAALEQNPDSVALQVAQARYDSMAGEFEAAIERLEQLRQRVPQERTVLAALLEAYFETGNVEAFNRLAASLPEPREHEPWLLTRMRGEYALEQEQYEAAATHFERVLEQDAANLPAQMSLARALAGQGNRQAEAEALQRAQTLSEIRVQLNSVRKDNRQALRELVEACRRAELDAAAQVFQMHADALDSTSGAAAQPPGATPPRSDRTTQETPPATPPSDTASDR
jgi:tetratricopeptide (TPR) repeat protein